MLTYCPAVAGMSMLITPLFILQRQPESAEWCSCTLVCVNRNTHICACTLCCVINSPLSGSPSFVFLNPCVLARQALLYCVHLFEEHALDISGRRFVYFYLSPSFLKPVSCCVHLPLHEEQPRLDQGRNSNSFSINSTADMQGLLISLNPWAARLTSA